MIDTPKLDQKTLDFITSFYSTSDDSGALQQYQDAFTEDGILKFGNAEFPASAIPALRKGMWDQVVKRKHTVSKIFQADVPKDYIILGHVDLDYENGHAAHGIDFAARMQFASSDVLKMKHYQVFFDATPGKVAKSLPHQTSSVKSTFVTLPNKQLHVRVTGSGPAVILLHGLGSNGTYWNGVVEASSVLKSSTCYMVDFDGHGHSPLSGPITIASLAQDVVDLMNTLKISKATLVGHSMSGLVVAKVAEDHPDRTERLVCVGGVQQLPEAGVSNMRQRCSTARNKGLEPVSEAVANGALSAATKKNKSQVVEQVKALVRSTKPLSYIAACDALIEATDPDYSIIKASTLLIGGSEDALAPPAALEGLASKIPNCRVEVLQDVGHWQAVEAPEKVAALIDHFGSRFLTDGASSSCAHRLIVGTFDSPDLYTLEFDSEKETLRIVAQHEAKGSHSWLALNAARTHLYATCWSVPPGLAAYKINSSGTQCDLINFVPTASRSGYITVSDRCAYSAGGASGEVYALDAETGGFSGLLQSLSYVDEGKQQDSGSVMDFGGLRHGAHSADLSPDGKTLYVADIGRNCIWTSNVDKSGRTFGQTRVPATRPNDGPRHVWPHPNGKLVYSLQEHSCYVDIFEHTVQGLVWRQGARIIPEGRNEKEFWADEVRLSLRSKTPDVLFASTRGLEAHTKGFLAAYELRQDGFFANPSEALHLWETPTSGGWANAIEPASFDPQVDYMALTCSESSSVSIIAWRNRKFECIATCKLPRGGSATAQWLN